jgi:hypothetical protein
MTGRARALVALALALVACANRDVVAIDAVADRNAYCQGTGPNVLVDGTCIGRLAEAAFGHAACACGSLSITALTSDGFDSRTAPWAPGGAGADVGGNGGLDFSGAVAVGGSLTIAGDVQAGTRLDVLGDLDVGSSLGRPSSAIVVGGAARIGGDVDVGALHAAGTLTMPASAARLGDITPVPTTGAVTVPAPCRCDAVDVPAIVDAHRTANHDAAIGLAPDALANLHGDVALDLPCGRFYLTRIQADGGARITLRASGRTALFVAGGVTVDGILDVQVAEGAELDVFVTGSVNLPATALLGDPARPRALRIYADAGGAIELSAGSRLAGNLYAPAADLASSAPLEVFGSLLVGHLAVDGGLTVHRDRAISSAGAACQR